MLPVLPMPNLNPQLETDNIGTGNTSATAVSLRVTIFRLDQTCFPIFLGTSPLKLVGQLAQGGAQALGLGLVPVHDRILKQGT